MLLDGVVRFPGFINRLNNFLVGKFNGAPGFIIFKQLSSITTSIDEPNALYWIAFVMRLDTVSILSFWELVNR